MTNLNRDHTNYYITKNHTGEHNKPNVGVITPPYPGVREVFLPNFLDIIEPMSNEVCVITGRLNDRANEKTRIIEIKDPGKKKRILAKLIKEWRIQFQVSIEIFKVSRRMEILVFLSGAQLYLLPVLAAKLLRKKVILAATGLASKSATVLYRNNKIFSGFGGAGFSVIRLLERVILTLADQIVVESESALHFLGLEGYRKKIIIGGAGSRYIDTNIFKIINELKGRGNRVGYIGRLSDEKGVMNFVDAIPVILKVRDDVDFLIGGDGSLLEEIKGQLTTNNLNHHVELTGWISHDDELPDYLNELKLLILPSFTEGLPGIIQEAMACGTVVLATPVGGIPDLIKDGETGFMLENNSPECIAQNIIRVLKHPKLDEIVLNARRLIQREYGYESMVQKCRASLYHLMGYEAEVHVHASKTGGK